MGTSLLHPAGRRPSRRELLGGVAATSLASLTGVQDAAGARPGAPRRPNVLVLLTDQHHRNAMGCAGNDRIETPELDLLAAAGTRFSLAVSASGQCAPSRYSLWTGRHVRGHGLLRNGMRGDIRLRTVAEHFRDAGWHTATIGKHHVRASDLSTEHGFDEVVDRRDYVEFLRRRHLAHLYGPEQRTYPIEGGGMEAGASPLPPDAHEAAFWVDRTIDLVRARSRRPFCAWVSFFGPHPPVEPSMPWAERYEPARLELPPNHAARPDPGLSDLVELREKQGWSEERQLELLALYYGYVSQIDHEVGRLLEALGDEGLADETLVVFTADHGEMMGEHGVWTKGYHGYDATLRVPLVLRAPGRVPAGEVRDDLVSSVDLLPTLLSLAGLPVPDGLDGRPFLGDGAPARRFAYAETGVADGRRATVCRSADAKHVRFELAGELVHEQYFDLVADPWETTNLVEEARADGRLAPLLERHLAWLADASGREPAEAPRAGDAPR